MQDSKLCPTVQDRAVHSCVNCWQVPPSAPALGTLLQDLVEEPVLRIGYRTYTMFKPRNLIDQLCRFLMSDKVSGSAAHCM